MKLHLNNALSLTELLIASALISIVMAGVAVFSTSMKQMQSTSQTTRYTDIKITALMKAVRQDAQLAIGDSTNSGIQTNTVGSTRSICFRHDVSASPEDYSDDIWACWYHHADTPGIMRCYDVPSGNVPPVNLGMCNSAASTRDYFELSNIDFFTLVLDPDSRLRYVTISLTAHDTRQGVDSLTNPDITLATNVSPQMLAR